MKTDDTKGRGKSGPKRQPGSVFDVRRPGSTFAPPTSRPVISSHRPEAQAAQTAVSGVGESTPVANRRKILIAPSGDIEAADEKLPTKDEPVLVEPQKQDATAQEKDALAVVALDATTGVPDLPPESTAEEDDSKFVVKTRVSIQPPSESPQDQTGLAESEQEQEAQSKQEEQQAPEQPEQEQEEPEATQEQPATPDAEQAVIADETQKETTEGQAKEELLKPEPHIEPLFDDHGVIASSRNNHGHKGNLGALLLVCLVIVLAVVALDVLLDLEILTLPGIPHTDFL